MLFPLGILAQGTLSGVVLEAGSKKPLPGVNITVQGTTSGVSSDLEGHFKIGKLKKGDKIQFEFLGYRTEIITFKEQSTITVYLDEEANQLKEVVIQVGYGSVRKKDATGSVAVVTSKDFNKGAITSADQLLTGKAPGVRITNDGGAPDSAPNIRIRGGASLAGNNNPLIVIDNVPIDNQNPAGINNPLTMINPNDIESFTILKDASATAIYGARASNGVIIITTKKGTSGTPQFTYSNVFSIGSVPKKVNVMDGPTYANFINTRYPAYSKFLGAANDVNDPLNSSRTIYNTDWQDVIYRTTFNQDHNFSARANLFGFVPFRASVGYNSTQGIVKYNDFSRLTASFKLTPTFLNNHLKIDINAKGLTTKKNNIDSGGAIGNAINMDPTKPVYGPSPDNRFGGYYQETSLFPETIAYPGGTSINAQQYKTVGATNPLAILEQANNPERVNKFIGNIEFDYKFHFLPELKAVLNLGMEASRSELTTSMQNNSIGSYGFIRDDQTIAADPHKNYVFNPGLARFERQSIMNKTLDFYLQYSKKFKGIITRFDSQFGYTFQHFINDGYHYSYLGQTAHSYPVAGGNPIVVNDDIRVRTYTPYDNYYNPMKLAAFFNRTNIDLMDKFLLTFTIRREGTSLFSPERRWGTFPSAALAWRMKDESFMKNVEVINDLKVRTGYGITGNCDVRSFAGYFSYIPLYQATSNTVQYLPGVNNYDQKPIADLTWETTYTFNIGVDFDLFKNNLLSGSIDLYSRRTTDLFARVPVPAGQGLTNVLPKNVGSMSNKGIEINLIAKPLNLKSLSWTINGNLAYNYGTIDDLNGAGFQGSPGGSLDGIGVVLAYNQIGQQPHSAWVYEQVYNSAGKPIPGVFVDRNGDGVINDNDKYYVPLRPNWTFGFGTTFTYKKFDLTASFRGQFGGKVYNQMLMTMGNEQHAIPTVGTGLTNVLNMDLPFVTTNTNVKYSDYFLENATFLRCESLSLGYKLDNLFKKSSARLFVGVNNLFLLTKYSGADPENFNSIDSNFYPRPRIWNFGCNIDF